MPLGERPHVMLQNLWETSEKECLFAAKQDKQLYIREWTEGVSHAQYLQFLQLFTANLRSILKTYF